MIYYLWREDDTILCHMGDGVCAYVPAGTRAAEMYLTEFDTKPFRPKGWRTDIDMRAEAEERLVDEIGSAK
jgi:hypothetical protein